MEDAGFMFLSLYPKWYGIFQTSRMPVSTAKGVYSRSAALQKSNSWSPKQTSKTDQLNSPQFKRSPLQKNVSRYQSSPLTPPSTKLISGTYHIQVLESIKPMKWGRLTCFVTLHSKKKGILQQVCNKDKEMKRKLIHRQTTKGKTQHPGSLATSTVSWRCLPGASKHIPK